MSIDLLLCDYVFFLLPTASAEALFSGASPPSQSAFQHSLAVQEQTEDLEQLAFVSCF